MIIAIGTDIIEVYRIRETVERTPRFVERVYTPSERAYCESKGAVAAQSFAARFAAKEAVLKAFKTGWRGSIAWHDIEITNDELGAPSVILHNFARELFEKSGATHLHISISHTSEHAVAQVIFEKNPTTEKE